MLVSVQSGILEKYWIFYAELPNELWNSMGFLLQNFIRMEK